MVRSEQISTFAMIFMNIMHFYFLQTNRKLRKMGAKMFGLSWMRAYRWPGRSNRRWVLRHKPQHGVPGRLPKQRPLRRDVQTRGAHGRLLLQGRRRPGPPCLLVHLAVPAGAGDDDDVVPGKYGVVDQGRIGWEWRRRSVSIFVYQFRVIVNEFTLPDPTR